MCVRSKILHSKTVKRDIYVLEIKALECKKTSVKSNTKSSSAVKPDGARGRTPLKPGQIM